MAGDANAIRAGKANVEIGGDTNPLTRALKAASTKIASWGKSLRSLGSNIAFGGALPGPLGQFMQLITSPSGMMAGFGMAVKTATDFGGQMVDMADRTGLGVEAVQELAYAAEMGGTDIETLEGAVRKMQVQLGKSGDVSQEMADSLRDLGMSVRDVRRMTPDKQFEIFAEAIAGVEDPAKRAALAVQIFGKSGAQLLPMLSEGAAGLREMRQRAVELGLVMSEEDARAAEELGDTMDTFGKVCKQVVATIGASLVPTVKLFLERAMYWLKWLKDTLKENKDFIVALARTVGVVVAAGAALGILGVALSWVAGLVSALAGVFGVLATVVGFLLSPVGLLIAAIGAIAHFSGALAAVGRGVSGVWQSIKTGFAQTWKDLKEAMGAIGAAIGAGEFREAFKVLIAFGKLKWAELVEFFFNKWYDLKEWFKTTMIEIWFSMKKVIPEVWAFIQTKWQDLILALKNFWFDFVSATIDEWVNRFDEAIAGIQKRINTMMGSIPRNLGGMGQAEASRRNAAIDRGVQQRRQNRADALDQRRQEARNTRDTNVRGIETERAAAIALLEAQRQAAAIAALAQAAIDRARGVPPSQAARDEFERATRQAREAARLAPREGIPGARAKKPGEELDLEGRRSIFGTFNPFQIRGLTGASDVQRIRKATEDSARHLATIAAGRKMAAAAFAPG